MPEYCASSYYDKYPPAEQIALATNPDPPAGVPQVAVQTSKAFRHWVKSPTEHSACTTNFSAWSSSACRLPDSTARTMRRAYYACVSQTDDLVGKVLAALKSNVSKPVSS